MMKRIKVPVFGPKLVLANLRKRLLYADNPNHEPAGSPNGGQFAPKGEGGESDNKPLGTGFKKTGGQLGSNPGGQYSDGKHEYYVKFYQNKEQAQSEVLAAKVYEAMGIKTLKPEIGNVDGKLAVITKWDTSTTPVTATDFSKLTPTQQADVGKMYMAAIVTKNWDIVGLAYDNIMHHDSGRLISVDQGGAFKFRAQGSQKPFGTDIAEYNSLKQNNGPSGHVFGANMTPTAEAAGIKALTLMNMGEVAKAFIHSGLDDAKELYTAFYARREALLTQADQQLQQQKASTPAAETSPASKTTTTTTQPPSLKEQGWTAITPAQEGGKAYVHDYHGRVDVAPVGTTWGLTKGTPFVHTKDGQTMGIGGMGHNGGLKQYLHDYASKVVSGAPVTPFFKHVDLPKAGINTDPSKSNDTAKEAPPSKTSKPDASALYKSMEVQDKAFGDKGWGKIGITDGDSTLYTHPQLGGIIVSPTDGSYTHVTKEGLKTTGKSDAIGYISKIGLGSTQTTSPTPTVPADVHAFLSDQGYEKVKSSPLKTVYENTVKTSADDVSQVWVLHSGDNAGKFKYWGNGAEEAVPLDFKELKQTMQKTWDPSQLTYQNEGKTVTLPAKDGQALVSPAMHETLTDKGYTYQKPSAKGYALYKSPNGAVVYVTDAKTGAFEHYSGGPKSGATGEGAVKGLGINDAKQMIPKGGEATKASPTASPVTPKPASEAPKDAVLTDKEATKGATGGVPKDHVDMLPGQKLTDAERVAVSNYKSSSTGTNLLALELSKVPKANATAVDLMDNALAKQRTNKDLVVFRGLGGKYAQDLIGTLQENYTFHPHFYQETSTSADTSHTFSHSGLMLKISVQKGTPAIDTTAATSSHAGEKGIIFSRNCYYKVKKIYKAKNGSDVKTWMDVDLVHPGVTITSASLVSATPDYKTWGPAAAKAKMTPEELALALVDIKNSAGLTVPSTARARLRLRILAAGK